MSARAASKQPFGRHLAELRSRFLGSLLCFLAASVVGYIIHPMLIDILVKPWGQSVFYTSPAGGFDFVLKVSLLFGFLVAIPVFLYHLLRFLEPVLPENSTRRLLAVMAASIVLLALGVSFAYLVSLPAALRFLGSFATGEIQALVSTDAYFSFASRYMLGFGVVFQLPLILWMINSINTITTRQLMHLQKWVLLGSFVVAAIMTPTPDVFNQLMMAVPPILLYQASIVFLWVLNRKAPRKH